MKLDPHIGIGDAPVIALAGAEYFIPMLAIRQNRIVVPALLRLLPRLAQLGNAPQIAELQAFTEDDFNDMVRIVHVALTRAYPDARLDELLDQPIAMPELMEALAVVLRQTGLFRPALSEAGDSVSLGEATGAVPPISTNFSPITASVPESLGPISSKAS